jgi:hypothetical protein
VVAHLHGIAGDAYQGPIGAQSRIVRMGCVTHGGVRLLVARAIAVPDRDECRHQKRLAGSVGALKAPTWTKTARGENLSPRPIEQPDCLADMTEP